MILLAFDCSTSTASIALYDDKGLLGSASTNEPAERGGAASHNDWLLRAIEGLLAAHALAIRDVSTIGVGVGPGGFTGVRLAVAAAHGLGAALDVPVLPVDSLIARVLVAAWDSGMVRGGAGAAAQLWSVCVDARMQEVIIGRYRANGSVVSAEQPATLVATRSPVLSRFAETVDPTRRVGDGWPLLPTASEAIKSEVKVPAPTIAEAVGWLARQWASADRPTLESIQPIYLRGEDAWRPAGPSG